MMKTSTNFLFASALALGLPNAAMAIPTTWVSSTGSDANACTRAAPCATMQVAHNTTDAGGEVNVIDSGSYGPVNITKSITIRAKGVIAKMSGTASALSSGYSATVAINAASTDVIILEGLTLVGSGAVDMGVGNSTSSGTYIIDCTISKYIYGASNYNNGVGSSRLFIQRSNLFRNEYGALANGAGRVTSILDSLIDGSSIYGVYVVNSGIIGMARSVINAGPTAMRVIDGASQIISIGPSNIISGTGNFTATVPFN